MDNDLSGGGGGCTGCMLGAGGGGEAGEGDGALLTGEGGDSHVELFSRGALGTGVEEEAGCGVLSIAFRHRLLFIKPFSETWPGKEKQKLFY